MFIKCFAFRKILLRISRKFRPNFNFVFPEIFVKQKKNFAKPEIDIFAKFLQKRENENFRSHPMSATSRKKFRLYGAKFRYFSTTIMQHLLHAFFQLAAIFRD